MPMTKRTWATYLLGASLLACSSAPKADDEGTGSQTSTGDDSSDDDSTPASDSGPRKPVKDAGHGSSESDAGDDTSEPTDPPDAGGGAKDGGHVAADAGPKPDANGVYTVTLKMDDFTVNAGDEVYMCQQVGNPFGQDIDIISMDGTMSSGSHHFFMFDMDSGRNTASPLAKCPGGGLEFHPFPYLSQQPHFAQTMPSGFGYPLNTGHGLMFNVHYLNATSKPLSSKVSLTIKYVKRGVVKTHVGTLFLNNTSISVPPIPKGLPRPFAVSTTPLATDFSLMTSWSHMHQWATDFRATINGQQFYEEPNWDEPQLFQHEPPLQVKGNTSFTWTCDYYNDTGKQLTFGDSAINNVMCIYFGWYYPADPDKPGIVKVLQ